MAATWLLLFHYLSANERLLARHAPASFFALERRRALLGVVAYLVAALLSQWRHADRPGDSGYASGVLRHNQ
jgi:hypothetical protein